LIVHVSLAEAEFFTAKKAWSVFDLTTQQASLKEALIEKLGLG